MNILAIDQARNGAWSVFDEATGGMIGYGTFSFDTAKYTYEQAILHIEEIIAMVIDAYDIVYVVIEDINMRQNIRTFQKLAQLQGVLVNLCERNKLKYECISPTKWQSYCRNVLKNSEAPEDLDSEYQKKGRKESKLMSRWFAKSRLGVDTKNDNLSDALCIGYYALHHITDGQQDG